ncbi:SDR family oxidoreductase [Candidatus Saccharibacteria bacterium]|nr:SDR family oxidoreductase [Candidatus Saccharibacteria bacterium]
MVLVTGGTSGIGKGIVDYFLNLGTYELIVLSRQARADETNLHYVVGDVTNSDDIEQTYNFINEKYGKLDGIVNCAGIIHAGGIEKITLSEWQETLDVNLTAPFTIIRQMLPLLKKGQNPAIVNISSISSIQSGDSVAYCASKAGLDLTTQCLAKELGKYNIRVNSVNPGMTRSNLWVANGSQTEQEYESMLEKITSEYPLQRICENPMQDIAPTVELLLSEKSLWTTGSLYVVDGGRLAWK